MIPYPWKQRKWFHDRRMFATGLRKYIGRPLAVIGFVLSLSLSWLVAFMFQSRYDRVNDQWWKGGLIMVIVGAIGSVILGGPLAFISAISDLLYSFGTKATMEPATALRHVFFSGAPLGFILNGFAHMIDSYWYEYHGERYLKPTQSTYLTRRKIEKAKKVISTGANDGDGWMKFGVITGDPIPWRTPRVGMIAQRPMKSLGHGMLIGTNGVGKTVAALNIMYQAAVNDAATMMIDFKGSRSTYRSMKAIARETGRPFYTFDVGLETGERTWYDPLAWKGTPSEKTSMLVAAFEFSESGDASFYRNVAEQWMNLQFEIMDSIGVREGEGRFDFLLETSTTQGLKNRLNSSPVTRTLPRERVEMWQSTMASVKQEHLGSLRANLSKIVNAGGERLRPQKGIEPLSLKKIADEGAVAYIGLSPMTDGAALKGLGSLLIRDLGVLVGDRLKQENVKHREFVVLVDEASRMGSRASVMDDLFTQSREARVRLWVATQSLAAWPATTRREMAGNVTTRLIMRVQDPETQSEMEALIGKVPSMILTGEGGVQHDALRGETTTMDGENRYTIGMETLLSATDLASPSVLEVGQAFLIVTGSFNRPTRKKWKSKRVTKDDVKIDAPLIDIVLKPEIMEPDPEVDSMHSVDTEMIEDTEATQRQGHNGPTAQGAVPADHDAGTHGNGEAFDGPAPATKAMVEALPLADAPKQKKNSRRVSTAAQGVGDNTRPAGNGSSAARTPNVGTPQQGYFSDGTPIPVEEDHDFPEDEPPYSAFPGPGDNDAAPAPLTEGAPAVEDTTGQGGNGNSRPDVTTPTPEVKTVPTVAPSPAREEDNTPESDAPTGGESTSQVAQAEPVDAVQAGPGNTDPAGAHTSDEDTEDDDEDFADDQVTTSPAPPPTPEANPAPTNRQDQTPPRNGNAPRKRNSRRV